ncbi:hypothetical protein DRE_00900 [Drechslerella stenobrocha 248]|uniref:Uncharacterized protein n=1 Tax=Drechslerella stenobrocha 248 TaxID=1043628 RepID=W7HLG5_9PEZI|nr:hypothetical protein DRE_00900 [Drechslerella stenobrocha 248]
MQKLPNVRITGTGERRFAKVGPAAQDTTKLQLLRLVVAVAAGPARRFFADAALGDPSLASVWPHSRWFLDIFKRSMDPFPRLSREEVLAAVDQMDLQQKREGLFYLKVKSAYCDPPEIVDATIRNMTATLFDGLYLIDPVASYDNWKEGPDLWAWRLDNRTDENEPQNGGGCNGSPCHGNTEQCDPHPPNNKCDITTSCIQTGQSGGHYCACRAGYKADALDDDISVHHRASFSGQEYRVFVKPGIKCDTLCKWDSLGPINCGEVKVLSN